MGDEKGGVKHDEGPTRGGEKFRMQGGPKGCAGEGGGKKIKKKNKKLICWEKITLAGTGLPRT